MVFKGQPNLYVRIANKYVQRATGKKGFSFNENGEYETDNETLIKLLSQHFETKEENTTTSESINEEKVFKCKKCDFETTNKGLLLQHYKNHAQ